MFVKLQDNFLTNTCMIFTSKNRRIFFLGGKSCGWIPKKGDRNSLNTKKKIVMILGWESYPLPLFIYFFFFVNKNNEFAAY